MRPLLCVTVTAPTMSELRSRRDEVPNADLIELRLDTVSDPSAAGALADRSRPVVVTCRPTWEGGQFAGSEEERHRILGEAMALGAEYVDIEWRARFDDLIAERRGRQVVLSAHDFGGMPADLTGQMQAMRSSGAEVVKIAVKTSRLSDCVPLLDLGAQAGRHGGLVLVGMGEQGLVTRVLAERFASMWTYAGSQREVGQVSAATLLNDYRFRTLGETTSVYGEVGYPVAHSVSPAMHNAAFAAAGLDAVYLPFPAVTAEDFVTFGRCFGIKGASVTTPHEISLFDHVDEVDAVARRVGAINTIRNLDGRWVGSNTDVDGFLQPLADKVPLHDLKVAVVGAGGAARAVAVALAPSGCRVRVHARDRQQAEGVAILASAELGPYPPEPGSWDMLINCTPIGMYPKVDETPIDPDQLTGQYVYDLVYNPTVTRLLRDATRAGLDTLGGLDMLVAQAQEQFHWWTDNRPPAGVMREAALKRLAEFRRDEDYVV